MSSIKTQSAWKDVNGVFVKVGGQWKTVTESYVKVNGVWKLTTFSTGPEAAPQMTHDGYGRFKIVNHDPNLVYDVEFVGGDNRVDGSRSRSGDTFTLGSTQSAYNVYSRFVANGPRSPAGYMERRRITFTTTTVIIPRTCQREVNEDYPASFRDETRTHVGDTSNCAVYSCPPQFPNRVGPDGSNRCQCFGPPGGNFVIGGGCCPNGNCGDRPPSGFYDWFICNGNRCCYLYPERIYSCPSGGSLSGTTCIRRRQEDYDCSYPEQRSVENPVPVGYNRSPGTANVQGEWWRVTR